MQNNCDGECASCETVCGDAQIQASIKAAPNELSRIRKLIAVMSGKGGVGKSLVTSLLAVLLSRHGYSVAVLDADITGPSIPKMFGITENAQQNEFGLFPVRSKSGIAVMSLNLLIADETEPMIWRGPMIAGLVKQFFTDVIWGDVDFMLVDMPPGTGDVPLTVFESLPVDGAIVVTTPQQLVSMIVQKAVNMAEFMHVPVLGMVENMSYLNCPDCGRKIELFSNENAKSKSGLQDEIAVSDCIPIDSTLSAMSDSGMIELFNDDLLSHNVAELIQLIEE